MSQHNWIKETPISGEATAHCTGCGARYGWHQTRPVEGCNQRYIDNDTLRPSENERIKRELGHELENYDWSDK